MGYGYGHSSPVMLPGLTSVGVGGPAGGVWAWAATAAPITVTIDRIRDRLIATSRSRVGVPTDDGPLLVRPVAASNRRGIRATTRRQRGLLDTAEVAKIMAHQTVVATAASNASGARCPQDACYAIPDGPTGSMATSQRIDLGRAQDPAQRSC